MSTSGMGIPFNTTPTSGVGGAFAGMNNGSDANFGLGVSGPSKQTGASGYLPTPSTGNGSMPFMGYQPGQAGANNGVNTPNGFVPPTTGGSSYYNPTGADVFGMNPTTGTYQWLSSKDSSLTNTYGKDAGSALGQFVQSGAGFNQGEMDQLFNSMLPQEYQQMANISNQQGTQGTRFSSANDFANSNYMAQVNSTQTQAEFNEYNQSIQNMMAILMGSKNVPTQNNSAQLIESGVGAAVQIAGAFV